MASLVPNLAVDLNGDAEFWKNKVVNPSTSRDKLDLPLELNAFGAQMETEQFFAGAEGLREGH